MSLKKAITYGFNPTIHNLYGARIEEIAHLSEAKYGIRCFCPDNGRYTFDRDSNQVVCSEHGNRESSHQNAALNPDSSFARFIGSVNEVVAALRFEDDALIATIEIDREQGE